MALTQIRGTSQILDGTISNAKIAAGAGIELSKIQDGTSLVKSNGTISFTSPVSGATPTQADHLATKEYVDGVAAGLDVKKSVRAVARTNITLSGAQTIDGVSLVAGERILVVGQTDETQNGIYVVASGAWSRATDADSSAAGEVSAGMFTFVEEGTTGAGTGWVLSTPGPIVLGTTDLEFTQFSEAGQVGAGAGLVANGTAIDVVSGNGGIVVNPDNITLTVDPNGTLAITSAGIKLADLQSGRILVGSAGNVATAVVASGDLTISNTGVFTIAADAITTTKINNLAVTSAKIALGAVGTNQLADSGVTTAKINDLAVTTDKLAADSVTSDKIANNAVGTSEIAAAAVTLGKIETLATGNIIIGTAGGNASVAVSGDITLSSTGVATINSATVVRVQDVITRETPTGTLDGTNPVFVLANTPKAGTEHVFLNGLLMDAGAGNDYTISGATITFTFNPVAGDKIRVSYIK